MGSCKDKALDLVGRRPHFRQELHHKLRSRGFPEAEIEEALEDLARLGLLDDLGHARDLAAGSMSRKGYGPRRMRLELLRRGLSEDLAETVVDELYRDPESEYERALELARRQGAGSSIKPDRLARQLDRRGYSKAVILRVLEVLETD